MINAADWKIVKRKLLTRQVLRFLEINNIAIDNVFVSDAFGSVYIEVARGEWDDDYEMYGEGDTFKIRISDHERTSSNHICPDLNIVTKFTDNEKEAILEWVNE